MKKIRNYMVAMLAAIALTGCDQLVAHFVDTDDLDLLDNLAPQKKDATHVQKVVFSPDYKTFVVTTRMSEDIGPYSLTDTCQVKTLIEESAEGIAKSQHSQPRLISERNLKAENIYKSGVKTLVLIDATLPQTTLDRIRNYVIELKAVFSHDNLYAAFMRGDSVTKSMLITDYILDHYFKKDAADSVFLYRSILQKKDEMTSRQGPWSDARKMALLIFSNEKIYNETTDSPFDPNHYLLEEQMVNDVTDPDFLASYVSMKSTQGGTNNESAVLRQFCSRSHGIYMSSYNGTSFKNNLLTIFHISPDANEFTFENPDGKVYRGNHETLTVKFVDTKNDSIITSFSTTINEGSIYNPIIVHGEALPIIIIRSLMLALIIILGVWLLFQFVIPFIRYRIFLKRYVVRYTGTNMGIGNTMVQEKCYLCKQPFETGEKIVVKCGHTMHKTCWDENEYHCPEYSDRCEHGTHYYNRQNLTDSRNASFYMKWIIMAIVAAWLAWLGFIVKDFSITKFFVSKLIPEESISPLASFGLFIGFFLTLGISVLSTKIVNVHYNEMGILLRAVLAALGCYLVFLFSNILVIAADIQILGFLIEWISWTISGFIITLCGTYGTRIKLRKSLLLPGIAVCILSMYAWWLFFDADIDYRVLLLFSFIFYAVGLAVSVATLAPRSERYFLRVQGAVKEMDIAIYKWFRNANDRVVTLGKSVDCSLQLSWDIMGHVAPVNAEIRLYKQVPYLVALEEGVFISGKPVVIGKKVWLSHGKSFTIGNTTFTYIEKDL